MVESWECGHLYLHFNKMYLIIYIILYVYNCIFIFFIKLILYKSRIILVYIY